jgi:hypothetical protein
MKAWRPDTATFVKPHNVGSNQLRHGVYALLCGHFGRDAR